ncbi:MAG: glycosyltransferase [Pseudobdellovibrio sp.]
MLFNYHILILSYNHPNLTALTIKSVLDLNFPAEKIALVHNGSLLQHTEALQLQFPQINHLVMPVNKGFSGGANFGLSEIFKQTDSILFLTNDTEVIHLAKNFQKNYDFFSVLILKRKTNNLDSCLGTVNLKTGRLTHIKSMLIKPVNSLFIKTYIPGTAFGITKTVFQRLNGFDENLHTYWEDVDLSLRAHQQNIIISQSSDFKVKHKIGKTCHKDRFYTLFLFQRNRKRILKRYGLSRITFYWVYSVDMIKILLQIITKDDFKKNLNLWWKAIYDRTDNY